MKILALDSSTAASCSAALWCDGQLHEHARSGRHGAAALLSMIQCLLQKSQLRLEMLDAVAFAAGPGSFTGLRVCAGVTQGLAHGGGLPVVPVSTLAALAQQLGERPDTPPDAVLLPALDARAGAVYWGAYRMREGVAKPLWPDAVMLLEELAIPVDLPRSKCIAIGDGWRSPWQSGWREIIARSDPAAQPRAREVLRLGAAYYGAGTALPAEEALPVYLRWDIGLRRQDMTRHDASSSASGAS